MSWRRWIRSSWTWNVQLTLAVHADSKTFLQATIRTPVSSCPVNCAVSVSCMKASHLNTIRKKETSRKSVSFSQFFKIYLGFLPKLMAHFLSQCLSSLTFWHPNWFVCYMPYRQLTLLRSRGRTVRARDRQSDRLRNLPSKGRAT